MSSCEKCWRDAHRVEPYGDISKEYSRLVNERSCTPEDQAGEDATICSVCKRKTIHQHTHKCMNKDCINWEKETPHD